MTEEAYILDEFEPDTSPVGAGGAGSSEVSVLDVFEPDLLEVPTSGGGVTLAFKMRGRDDGRTPGSDYIVWTSTGSPDFAGTGFASGDPTPLGNLIVGSVVKIATLSGQ